MDAELLIGPPNQTPVNTFSDPIVREADFKQVHGVVLRRDPARDDRFDIVQHSHELAEFPAGSCEWRRESLHRHMNTEVQSLEIAAQTLAEFPDAPWDIRLDHARQCWDEARHAAAIADRLRAQGGFAGEFPIINYDWGVACAVDTLAARIALQNRTVEAGEMDLLRALRDAWRKIGDIETAQVMDAILADEVQHVRFANLWLKAEMKRNPRVLIEVGRAIDYLKTVTAAFTPEADMTNAAGIAIGSLDRTFAVNESDRALAGFSAAEIGALSAEAA